MLRHRSVNSPVVGTVNSRSTIRTSVSHRPRSKSTRHPKQLRCQSHQDLLDETFFGTQWERSI